MKTMALKCKEMKMLISILFILPTLLAKSQITTWQAPEGFSLEKYYQVKYD
jgi:hypothetical protein